VDVRFAEGLRNSVALTPNPADVTFRVAHPWILRGGVRYAARDAGGERWDVELDGTYESWKGFEPTSTLREGHTLSIPAAGERGVLDSVFRIPHGWQDSMSVRLGGAYTLRRIGPGALALRAGANGETATARDEYSRLDFSPFRRVGAAAGLGYTWGWLAVNLAYEHVWHETREIADSRQWADNLVVRGYPGDRDLDGLGDEEPRVDEGFVNGNGRFETAYDLLALSLVAQLDEAF
jgi:long-subunit fatty acid transport protein